MSGTNSKGQFSIKDGVSKIMSWMMVPGLLLWRTRRPLTLSLMSMPLCNRWERILVRVQANAVYDLGRSDQNGSITYSSKAISENMVINNGRANVWAGTMVNVSVRGMMAFLRS